LRHHGINDDMSYSNPRSITEEVAIERQRTKLRSAKNGPERRVARFILAQLQGKKGYGIPPV
jgi:hypothetical protein